VVDDVVVLALTNASTTSSGAPRIAGDLLDGEAFEQFMASLHANFLRPDRRNEPTRFGFLGGVRQWIESVFWTCKGLLALECHGARTDEGLAVRIALRLLALASALWHNQLIGQPGRYLAPYNH